MEHTHKTVRLKLRFGTKKNEIQLEPNGKYRRKKPYPSGLLAPFRRAMSDIIRALT
jgi:hypothetical protein